MPTYEYRCADCGHTFDIVQAFTDDSLTVCPECAGRLKKVFSNVAISFKGSGFYVTDSADAKASASESAGESSSTGSSDSSTASSDSSTPAPTTESKSTDTKATTGSD